LVAGLPVPDADPTPVSGSWSETMPIVIECFRPSETVAFTQRSSRSRIVAQMRHQTRAFPPFLGAEMPHELIFDSSEIHLISLF
jgi:hypothetical protein